MIRFGGVISKKDARVIRPRWIEIRTPRHLALIHDAEGTVAFRDSADHYFFLESKEPDLNQGIEAWIPQSAEYPHQRHRVQSEVLGTVCPRHRDTDSIAEIHEELWSDYQWESESTRRLCKIVLVDRAVCVEAIEFCRGLAVADSAFISVLETKEHRIRVLERWVAGSYDTRGDMANVAQQILDGFFLSVDWGKVYELLAELARVTPISRLPRSLRIKRKLTRRLLNTIA